MTKELFKKYLQGNCSEQEFGQLLSWMKDGAQHNSSQLLIKEIWDEFEPEAETAGRNKYNRILDKIHHQVNINQSSNRPIKKRTFIKNRVMPVMTRAAAILLLPVLLLLIYTNLPDKRHQNNTNDLQVESPANSKTHLELGDGTKVWLNQGSKLIYPFRFEGKNRKVFLTGEAYFDVAHNKNVPFLVETNRIQVKATGTEFNVMAYPEDHLIETTLVNGKVILYDKNKNQIKSLTPNQSLQYDTRTNTYTTNPDNTEKNVSWKDGLLIFKNDSIGYIARKLSRWYNAEIILTDERVEKYTCTATFADENLLQVLELLSLATAPIHYELVPGEKLPDGSYTKRKVLIGLNEK